MSRASRVLEKTWNSTFGRYPPARNLAHRLAGDKTRSVPFSWLVLQRIREGFYNIGYRIAGAADGYPFPPARLVFAVIANWQLSWYQLGGMFSHQSFTRLLVMHGIDPNSLRAILDFGCGCGRILRHWPAATHELWGTDYNAELVGWCERRLRKLGRFSVNEADPPLAFEDRTFDLVYAYSVFTHFSRTQQRPWVLELARVLKPGGLLLLTFHGPSNAVRHGRSAEQLAEAGILVFEEQLAGTNVCTVYHNERYVRETLVAGLDVVDYVPGGALDASGLDIVLCRKPLAR
jgi:SAM-dependent methyltransferase